KWEGLVCVRVLVPTVAAPATATNIYNMVIFIAYPRLVIVTKAIRKNRIRDFPTPHWSATHPIKIEPTVAPMFRVNKKLKLDPRGKPASVINLGSHVFSPYNISSDMAYVIQIITVKRALFLINKFFTGDEFSFCLFSTKISFSDGL